MLAAGGATAELLRHARQMQLGTSPGMSSTPVAGPAASPAFAALPSISDAELAALASQRDNRTYRSSVSGQGRGVPAQPTPLPAGGAADPERLAYALERAAQRSAGTLRSRHSRPAPQRAKVSSDREAELEFRRRAVVGRAMSEANARRGLLPFNQDTMFMLALQQDPAAAARMYDARSTADAQQAALQYATDQDRLEREEGRRQFDVTTDLRREAMEGERSAEEATRLAALEEAERERAHRRGLAELADTREAAGQQIAANAQGLSPEQQFMRDLTLMEFDRGEITGEEALTRFQQQFGLGPSLTSRSEPADPSAERDQFATRARSAGLNMTDINALRDRGPSEIRDYLRDNLGWQHERITQALQQITGDDTATYMNPDGTGLGGMAGRGLFQSSNPIGAVIGGWQDYSTAQAGGMGEGQALMTALPFSGVVRNAPFVPRSIRNWFQ